MLAIGSRDVIGSEIHERQSRVRELLGKSYNRLMQPVATPGVADTQCGAKAATRSTWRQLLRYSKEPGYAWDAEIVAVALASGVDVREVPVNWRHDDRSKVRVWRDGASMVVSTPAIWFRSRRVAGLARQATLPSDSTSTEVFDEANARRLRSTTHHHWWFRSKAALVSTALRRAGPPPGSKGVMLDIGGGSGVVSSMLGWHPGQLAIVEGNASLTTAARDANLPAIRAMVQDVPTATDSVAIVTLLDVLEHLDDPVNALREARRVLDPGGTLVVTVPAHTWLWSQADVVLGHRRRYSRSALRRQITHAGFRPVVITTYSAGWYRPFGASGDWRSRPVTLGSVSIEIRSCLTVLL